MRRDDSPQLLGTAERAGHARFVFHYTDMGTSSAQGNGIHAHYVGGRQCHRISRIGWPNLAGPAYRSETDCAFC